MKRVKAMMKAICRRPPRGMGIRETKDGLEATFEKTGRRQGIRVELEGDQLVLTSRVLPHEAVTRSARRWRELAIEVWERNRYTDLVLFGFDRHDNLVGRAVHPKDTLDPREFRLYVRALLTECDRFEYVLTGEDEA